MRGGVARGYGVVVLVGLRWVLSGGWVLFLYGGFCRVLVWGVVGFRGVLFLCVLFV